VGFETNDDAGVLRLSAGLRWADGRFFTPIVDDPFSFGQIAAANALSDVYAMADGPFPPFRSWLSPKRRPGNSRRDSSRGLAKMTEAGCTVIGGTPFRDDDMKFGYAVTGLD